MMQFEWQSVRATEIQADALVVFVSEGEPFDPSLRAVDERLDGALAAALERGEFKPRVDKTWMTLTFGRLSAKRVIAVGLGEKPTMGSLRQAAGQAAGVAQKAKIRHLAYCVPSWLGESQALAAAVSEGAALASWRFSGYHQKPRQKDEALTKITLLGFSDQKECEAGMQRGKILANAQNLTRELGSRPSNELYPQKLAEAAVEAGKTYGFDVEVFDEVKLAELKMGALLGVGSGSVYPPRLVVMRYQGGGDKTLGLVGKGITFDSGGISLKPPAGMEEMKYDMLGAGAVLGAMTAIAQLRPPINVVGIMAIAQNMPSGSSYKPGDVVTAFNGKTIEVTNTDAEGRVVLADGVSYAAHLGVDWIVETSTLTGAAIIVLGHEATALVATDDALASQVETAANAEGERVWRLPIYPEYRKLYESDVADIKNSPGRDAGTITGGMIISEFAGDVPFAHLDIAGTAWTKAGPLNAKFGPTGVMVRTFAALAELMA
ncbi:MAG: leucyl aminopeptidase [Firmicutes bacterium]|nr:leucyl aminopeptidase [Bacillota bacterium]